MIRNEDENNGYLGRVTSIDGSIIEVAGIDRSKIGDVIKIGKTGLLGEVIKHMGEYVICQCYDFLKGIGINERVINIGEPLSLDLGPGLIGSIFDGIQRPLNVMYEESYFIEKGMDYEPLNSLKKWFFTPEVLKGAKVQSGDIIGVVKETSVINHQIMVPLGVEGIIEYISPIGDFTIKDIIYSIKDKDGKIKKFTMVQKWPIRKQRLYESYKSSNELLITGTRVIDFLFPVAKGGTVAIPGGFGTGKTVIHHSVAKWANADIVVYVGCGERGNELADVLESFPELEDPYNNRPLMEKMVIIGNTSNMPVAAREASIFSGITIAEYYRDMGYNVVLLADSTSRWAEALRELSASLEEIPTEGGYPAYLTTRLAEFYERAGYVKPFGTPCRDGSVTIIASVSPPSGNFSEPVTKTTRRFTKTFWGLDQKLAYSRFYPAINYSISYSYYLRNLKDWWIKYNKKYLDIKKFVNTVLSKNLELEKLIKLVGFENLPRNQQLIIKFAEIIKQNFLIQNAFDNIDAYSSPVKTMGLINMIHSYYLGCLDLLKYDVPIFRMMNIDSIKDIRTARFRVSDNNIGDIETIRQNIMDDVEKIRREYSTIEIQSAEVEKE